jgi:hypothetical protein
VVVSAGDKVFAKGDAAFPAGDVVFARGDLAVLPGDVVFSKSTQSLLAPASVFGESDVSPAETPTSPAASGEPVSGTCASPCVLHRCRLVRDRVDVEASSRAEFSAKSPEKVKIVF